MNSGYPIFGRRPLRAVTLIELLVVVALMALFLTLLVPATSSMLGAQRMDQAAQSISTMFGLAKQGGLSSNQTVEMRLYRKEGETNYTALQVVRRSADGSFQPMVRLAELPANLIFSPSTTLSSLMSRPERTAGDLDPAIPGLGADYSYRSVIFRPNGATDLPPDSHWFLTVVPLPHGNSSDPPDNFVTASIDPVTGSTTIHRP